MTLHLAVALEGTGWHPAVVARARGPPRRGVHRRVLGRPGPGGRGAACSTSSPSRTPALQPPRPDERTDRLQGRLDAVLSRAAGRPRSRPASGSCRRRSPPTPSRSTSPSRSPRSTTSPPAGRRAGRGVERPRRGPTPPLRPARPRRPRRAMLDLFDEAADHVEVHAAALGQLGGRRRDPRRRDRPVRRPREAALHRLRRREFSRARPVDHPAPAAGPAAGHRARPRRRPPTASRPAAPTSCSSPRATAARTPARDRRARSATRQAGAGREGDPLHVFGDLSCSSTTSADAARRAPAPPRRHRRRRATRSDAAHLHRHRHRRRRPARGVARRPASTGFRLRPAVLPHDLDAITRGLVPELQRRGAVPHRVRGDHPAGLFGLARPANRYATLKA